MPVLNLNDSEDQDKDSHVKDSGVSAGKMASAVSDTAKVLEAFSSCQTTLTIKIEEVKVDISLIQQDLRKLCKWVKDINARLGNMEDSLPPL